MIAASLTISEAMASIMGHHHRLAIERALRGYEFDRKVLAFIVERIQSGKPFPTYAEIAGMIGRSSHNQINSTLNTLVDCGILDHKNAWSGYNLLVKDDTGGE
jgi:hypothetical protein